MSFFNRLRTVMALGATLLLMMPEPLPARNRKGDKLVKQAQAAEALHDYDKALALFEQALSQDPQDPGYLLGMRRTRFEAGEVHVEKGLKLRSLGQLDQALAEFETAFSTDPSSSIAVQEMRTTMAMLDQAKKHPDQSAAERALTPVELYRQKQEKKLEAIEPVPELKPITSRISELKMNNQPPRVLYETVGKLAGVNVIIDPQFNPQVRTATLDLTNSTLEDALDYIALETHTFWQPISPNAIFVAEDTPTKRRDYENEAVKVFYLQNPTTAQEFQEIVTAVRSVTDCHRMYSSNALNAVIARCEVDKLNLVEKLLHDMDKPKSEVVVDVLVLQANSDKARTLAMGLTSPGSATGLNVPVAFVGPGASLNNTGLNTGTTTTGTTTTGTSTTGTSTGTTGTTASGVTTIGGIAHLSTNQFQLSLPGALLEAVMSDQQTRILQSPEVRASDGMKVTLNIGQKIPFASGSYTPGIAGVAGSGISPLVSTSFQYADVGVNLTLQPRIHGTDEVTMHVELDISEEDTTDNIGGVEEPVIGQRKTTTDIRVRDGEVSLLGGLMQVENTDNKSGIPGIYNVPVLGQLFFGSGYKDRSRTELIVALIPHIVRTPNLTDVDLRGVAAGTEQVVQLRYKQQADANGAGENPAQANATQPATPVPATVPPAPEPPRAVPVPMPFGQAAAPSGPTNVSFAAPASTVLTGAPVLATLQIANAADLFAVPIRVKWDPKLLRLNSITPGQLLSPDPQKLNAPIDIRNDAGEARIQLSRLPGAGGVTGSGPLATFAFTAIAPGTGTIEVTELAAKNARQEPIPLQQMPSMTVTIQPRR